MKTVRKKAEITGGLKYTGEYGIMAQKLYHKNDLD
jgi:hypothetical protein